MCHECSEDKISEQQFPSLKDADHRPWLYDTLIKARDRFQTKVVDLYGIKKGHWMTT